MKRPVTRRWAGQWRGWLILLGCVVALWPLSGAFAETPRHHAVGQPESPATALSELATSIDAAIAAARAGDLAGARRHFNTFDAGWDDLEDEIRPIARESYRAIEAAMADVSGALAKDQSPVEPALTALQTLRSVLQAQIPVIASAQPVTTRVYFIAAEEVDWDYAPSGKNQITGTDFDDAANTFVRSNNDRIGKVYRKSVYRAYTDATFTQPLVSDGRWAHLGLLGPVLRAEVGDVMQIHFKNKTRFPASIHAHGVRYGKDSEGALYADGTSGRDKADDSVEPGETFVYSWDVPERAGPGPMDPSSIVWMYHSHVDEVTDTNAGLVGPLIVTRRGSAHPDGTPVDVDREFVTLFTVTDENASPYLDDNIRRFAGRPATVKKDDAGFRESNHMHGINGFVYGHVPGLRMTQGERVRWYLLAVGTEVDLHTPHWHGQVGTLSGMRTDMVELLPGSMKVLDMVPDAPGKWLFHCHVNDYIIAGMQALFTVDP